MLTFDTFMIEFRASFLLDNWEEDTLSNILSLSQGNQTFWSFAISMQSKNALLVNMPSHLDTEKLRNQLQANITPYLKVCCHHDKIDAITNFQMWLKNVRRLDELLTMERKGVEAMMKAGRDTSHNNAALTELS